MDPIYVFISTDFGEGVNEYLRYTPKTTFRPTFFEKNFIKKYFKVSLTSIPSQKSMMTFVLYNEKSITCLILHEK